MRAASSRLVFLLLLALAASLCAPLPVLAQDESGAASIRKDSVDVHSAPDFKASVVATLERNAPIDILAMKALWFQIGWAGREGYVRVNDVRMQPSQAPSKGIGSILPGRAGSGLEVETAGVRALDENDLAVARFDSAGLTRLESFRSTPQAAAANAQARGWSGTEVAYAAEARRGALGGVTQTEKRGGLSAARSLLSRLGNKVLNGRGDAALDVADAAIGKSEEEVLAEELALGPQIAGRILGAAPLWQDDAAQRRINDIGRWMASQSTRPELPWTFGIIDAPEINAFAAPGGYILMTRGMYELLADDAELAAVLGHEIGHVVQRDHYNVIRKQQITAAGENAIASQIDVGGGVAEQMAKDYVRRHGAAVMLTQLDRNAEYRADEAAEVYLARSGFNPLALYAVLQKMAVLGTAAPGLAQLYKTHPSLDSRLDRIDQRGFATLESYLQR